MVFRYVNQVPPGGQWFYRVPETQEVFVSRKSLYELEYLVKRHYRVNNLPIPVDLSGKIVEYICQNVPKGFCIGEGSEVGGKARYLTYFDVLRETELLLRSATGTKSLVSPAASVPRARVCKDCLRNSLHLCTDCLGLRDTASRLLGGRRGPMDKFLGVCEVTRCALAGQVHLDAKWLAGRLTEDQRKELPSPCWIQ